MDEFEPKVYYITTMDGVCEWTGDNDLPILYGLSRHGLVRMNRII